MELYAFFELRRMRWIRFGVVLLLLGMGIGVFLYHFDDLRTFEAVCQDPVNVEAVVSVEVDLPYYDKYLSYTYDGICFDRVFYHSTKSTDTLWEDGSVITVSIDPRNPGALAEQMLSADAIHLALVLMAAGLSAGGYALALQNDRFRAWRLRVAQKRSRDGLDYAWDAFMLALIIWVVLWLALAVAFPAVCGATASCLCLLAVVFLAFLPLFDRISSR